LAAFEAMGVFRRLGRDNRPAPPLDANALSGQPRLANPHDAGADLTARARAYLHANCGHCHRFGGGGSVNLELHAELSLERTKAIDARPQQGAFDLPDARIVAPGDPHRSVLYYRMAKFGRGRMPHLGSELPDEAGLALVRDWIRQLPAAVAGVSDPGHRAATNGGEVSGALMADEVERRLAAPAAALELARAVAHNRLDPAARGRVLAQVAKLPAGNVRDLFEGYLPHEGRARKLGSNPRPAGILALKGDAERGRELFRSPALQCMNCHRVGQEGTVLGPELTTIGKDRTRAELLESVLDPSRRIDPPYIQYQVLTKAGRSASGLLVKKDAQEVVLRDAQNQEVRLRADEVEQLGPNRQSLMPEGALRDLTAQQAADLLEFLATRR
jgi:putative heme-binding domain-containing protein